MHDISERKKKWIEDHDRLSRLFVEDRLSFERERKRRIADTIQNSLSETRRPRLINLQKKWDSILRHAGSDQNRFVLIKTLFWNQVRHSDLHP